MEENGLKKTLIIISWVVIVLVFFASAQIFQLKENLPIFAIIVLLLGVPFILSVLSLQNKIRTAFQYLLLGIIVLLLFLTFYQVPYMLWLSLILFIGVIIYFIFNQKS